MHYQIGKAIYNIISLVSPVSKKKRGVFERSWNLVRKNKILFVPQLIDLLVHLFLFSLAMWISGVMQGLMWRAVNTDGTLTYSFVESLQASYPFYFVRFVGGLIFLSGMFLLAYNAYKTISVSGQSDVVATGEDTLTLVAGTGMAITTDAGNTSVTITADPVYAGLNFGTFDAPSGGTLDMGAF